MRRGWQNLSVALVFSLLGSANATTIHSSEAVFIGGIRQWITLNGSNDTDPILLFLHGGPGNSALGYSNDFTGELQKHFVVIQWDQRETGKTLELNSSPDPLTVSLFERDALALIDYLRSRFKKDKIYLMGHSWGGFLGLLVASHHPEILEGYFAVCPMVWQEESERLTLAIMKEKAIRGKDTAAYDELNSITIPFATGKDLYLHRKWLMHLMGKRMYSQQYVESWAVKWLAVFNDASRINFFSEAPELGCPVYFFLGGRDYQTFFELGERYYTTVKAPRKELFWFKDSAHSFLSAQQKKLQQIIINQLPERLN